MILPFRRRRRVRLPKNRIILEFLNKLAVKKELTEEEIKIILSTLEEIDFLVFNQKQFTESSKEFPEFDYQSFRGKITVKPAKIPQFESYVRLEVRIVRFGVDSDKIEFIRKVHGWLLWLSLER